MFSALSPRTPGYYTDPKTGYLWRLSVIGDREGWFLTNGEEWATVPEGLIWAFPLPSWANPSWVAINSSERRNMEFDPVNHPPHYTHYKGIEVIQLTEQLNFNRGNVVKYIARAGIKEDSDEFEDLKKAQWYLVRELQRICPNCNGEPNRSTVGLVCMFCGKDYNSSERV